MNFKLTNIKYSLATAAVIGLFTACEPEIDRDMPDYEQVRGDVDFSTFVALGNSLTAGVSDNRLNRSGQVNSYPAIMADKMAAVVPGFTFNQPLLPDGLTEGTLQFQGLENGTPVVTPSTGGLTNEEIAANTLSGRFNNLGIPGAEVADLTDPAYANPYFRRFSSSQSVSLVEEANTLNPTFFTLWIGNNDVLGFATGGGQFLDGSGNLQGEPITPVGEFEESYSAIISSLVAENPEIEGAIANIPNVADVAFFNVVPWNSFTIDEATAMQLNVAFKANIEGGVRSQVIRAVITEGARRQIIPPVAEAIVKKQVYDAAITGGATDEEAQAQANAYAETTEGQAAIGGLTTSLTDQRQPAAAHAAVEQQLGSEAVQANIQTQFDAALAADQDPERGIAEVLGEQGATAVNTNFQTQIAILKAAKYYPQFAAGNNGFVVESETSPTGIIQLSENARMLLTFLNRTEDEFNPNTGDILVPDYYAIDQEEMVQVMEAVNGYNAVINNIAQENTFALVDMNNYLNELGTSGITEDGINFTKGFITGNTFSLDGVHLTQRGYALVAKRFIQTINSYYNSKLPLPNVSNYPAIALPPKQAQ